MDDLLYLIIAIAVVTVLVVVGFVSTASRRRAPRGRVPDTGAEVVTAPPAEDTSSATDLLEPPAAPAPVGGSVPTSSPSPGSPGPGTNPGPGHSPTDDQYNSTLARLRAALH